MFTTKHNINLQTLFQTLTHELNHDAIDIVKLTVILKSPVRSKI